LPQPPLALAPLFGAGHVGNQFVGSVRDLAHSGGLVRADACACRVASWVHSFFEVARGPVDPAATGPPHRCQTPPSSSGGFGL